ncbi:unnamed protein product [Lactuca virosa]|uniref:Exoribonuclease phosphorolytic domain-containing protein n=1 Tax=Lactuca virosa TaxID=75947 RepID=A0AAU9PKT1_9ASTR|nr:unnamed protein product [Lactuca virosa]
MMEGRRSKQQVIQGKKYIIYTVRYDVFLWICSLYWFFPITSGCKAVSKGGIAQDLRTNGHKRLTYRPISVETGVIAQANGSARVKMGKTEVIVLPCLLNLLTNNHKKSIKKEACWTISNITAGNKKQIQSLKQISLALLFICFKMQNLISKKEAAWATSNATSIGSHDQIKYLVSEGCIKPLCDLLICPDPRIVTKGWRRLRIYRVMITTRFYEKAVKLLETYWLEEEDDAMPLVDAATTQPPVGDVFVPSGGFKEKEVKNFQWNSLRPCSNFFWVVKLERVRNLGKPVELVGQYYLDGADEVSFFNITGFRDFPLGDLPMLQVHIYALSFSFGGGIRDFTDANGRYYSSLEVASEYFRSGADKISIGSDVVYAAEEYLKTGVKMGKRSLEQIFQSVWESGLE